MRSPLLLMALVACSEHRATAPVEAGPPAVDASIALPAGFVDLPKATRVHVMDEWSGLAGRRAVFARLERKGAAFVLSALLAENDDAIHDPVPDPTVVQAKRSLRCRVYGPSNECLVGVPPSMPTPRRTVVDAALVEAFLNDVVKLGIDPKQDHPTGDVGTDDYPRVHVAVWTAGADEPIHLSVADNRLHWRVNGAFLAPDSELVGAHLRLNESYRAMVKAMGADAASLGAGKGGGR